MKKNITLLLLTFLLIGSLVTAQDDIDLNAEASSIYDDPQFEEVPSALDVFSLFSVSSATNVLAPGGSTLISVDEPILSSQKVCNLAESRLEITSPDGKKTNKYIKRMIGYPGEIIGGTFRWKAPNTEGVYKFRDYVKCLSDGRLLSIISGEKTITVRKPQLCQEVALGRPYCAKSGNTLVQDYIRCEAPDGTPAPSGVSQSSQIQDCSISGEQCISDKCVKLAPEQQPCPAGQVMSITCEDSTTVSQNVCNKNGITTDHYKTKCQTGLVCSGGQCVTPEQEKKEDSDSSSSETVGVCCKPDLPLPLPAQHFPKRTSCSFEYKQVDINQCVQTAKCGVNGCSPDKDGSDLTGATTKKKGIDADKLERASQGTLDANSCNSQSECSEDAECIGFSALPEDVQDELTRGALRFAGSQKGVCIIDFEEGKLSLKGIFDDLGVSTTTGYIIIGALVLFLIMAMGRK